MNFLKILIAFFLHWVVQWSSFAQISESIFFEGHPENQNVDCQLVSLKSDTDLDNLFMLSICRYSINGVIETEFFRFRKTDFDGNEFWKKDVTTNVARYPFNNLIISDSELVVFFVQNDSNSDPPCVQNDTLENGQIIQSFLQYDENRPTTIRLDIDSGELLSDGAEFLGPTENFDCQNFDAFQFWRDNDKNYFYSRNYQNAGPYLLEFDQFELTRVVKQDTQFGFSFVETLVDGEWVNAAMGNGNCGEEGQFWCVGGLWAFDTTRDELIYTIKVGTSEGPIELVNSMFFFYSYDGVKRDSLQHPYPLNANAKEIVAPLEEGYFYSQYANENVLLSFLDSEMGVLNELNLTSPQYFNNSVFFLEQSNLILICHFPDADGYLNISIYNDSLDEIFSKAYDSYFGAKELLCAEDFGGGRFAIGGYHREPNETDKFSYLLIEDVTEYLTNDSSRPLNSVLSVYPNPTRHSVRISGYLDTFISEKWILSDAKGNTLLSGIVSDSFLDISTRELPNGLYFLQIGNLMTRQIVVVD